MTFCDLTIYNDKPLLIRLCTKLDLLPNFEWFPLHICDGCGMPTGDAYSSGHLVPSFWDLHMFYLLRPILFRTFRYFTGLCSSNIPRYFLHFASYCDVGWYGYTDRRIQCNTSKTALGKSERPGTFYVCCSWLIMLHVLSILKFGCMWTNMCVITTTTSNDRPNKYKKAEFWCE